MAATMPMKAPLLIKIEQQIEKSLPPSLLRDYLAVKVSGLQLMFSDKTHPFMADWLKDLTAQNVAQKVATGIANIIRIVARESKGKMSAPAAMPAAISLMTHALDYIQRVKQIPVTPQVVDQVTQAVSAELTKLFGITQSQINQAAALAMKRQGEKTGPATTTAQAPPEVAPSGGLLNTSATPAPTANEEA